MTMYYIYKAIHPDGSVYYGITSKGIDYAKHQHRLSTYNSGGHTSYTGLSLYAKKTNTPIDEWKFELLHKIYDRDEAFQCKRLYVKTHCDCLNIKYKLS